MIFSNDFLLVIVLSLVPFDVSNAEPYECGDHGRFEYCIDEIPGCVIGCHCHPGYYFDTDTKICEPNSKLLDHHRRHNVIKPTRKKIASVTPTIVNNEATFTSNDVDGQPNIINKSTDDIGDWLYNQFFRTIENQVMNKTDVKELPTRRSNGPKMALSEKLKKIDKRSKKRRKENKLKKKLLRITEDDSIFEDSASADDSNSSDSSKDTNSEDDEHGHKKIIMVNRKQKRPLPSFIFLPNMETPFYPPLGLPPPPVMPMYPMVPVPPMVPMFPMPVTPHCDDNHKTTTESEMTTEYTTTLKTTEATTVTSTTEKKIDETQRTEKPVTEEGSTTKQPARNRLKHSKARSKKKLKDLARQHLIKRLKAKSKNIHPSLLIPPITDMKDLSMEPIRDPIMEPIHELSRPGQPMIDEEIPDTLLMDNINNQDQISPFDDSVDFKYISELIHRENTNKTDILSGNEFAPLNNVNLHTSNKIVNPKFLRKYRKSKYRRTELPVNKQNEDSYYSNIGKQIASLIRKIDAPNKEINFELRQVNYESPYYSYFKDNAATFWERSVRSPLKLLNSNKRKFEYLKRSNEILFNLENKVETIASTPGALKLQEIENIINLMEEAKKEIDPKNTETLDNKFQPNKNLNVNLWPTEIYESVDNMKAIVSADLKDHFKNNNIYQPSLENVIRNNKLSDANKRLLTTNINRFTIWQKHQGNEKVIQNNKISQTPAIYEKQRNKYFGDIPLNNNQIKIENRKEILPFFSGLQKNYFTKKPNNINVINKQTSVDTQQLLLTEVNRPKYYISRPSYFRNEIGNFDNAND